MNILFSLFCFFERRKKHRQKRNFLHLTGVHILNKKITAKSFYNRCLANRIREEDIQEREDGNTRNKLFILNNLMYIHKNAKMIGDFCQDKIFLFTKKIIGDTTAGLGFIPSGNYYVCNTSLKEDIRKITYSRRKIVGIVCKQIQDFKYNEFTYIDEKYRDIIFCDSEISAKYQKR